MSGLLLFCVMCFGIADNHEKGRHLMVRPFLLLAQVAESADGICGQKNSPLKRAIGSADGGGGGGGWKLNSIPGPSLTH